MAGTFARTADVLVIGGGPGGYMAAIRLGQLGRKTLLVEKQSLGGECLNRGCIPSKALIHVSALYDRLRTEGAEVGLDGGDAVRFDMRRAQAWKRAVVLKEQQGLATLLRASGVTTLSGLARFTGPTSAELVGSDGGRERIDFRSAVVATGAVPVSLRGFEPDGKKVLTAYDLLDLTELPKSMLILGGGVSGCELGEFLAQVGVGVTIVELLPQLLPGLDPELARELSKQLEGHGVQILTSTRATTLDRTHEGVRLAAEHDGKAVEFVADSLFVTVGKRAASEDVGLEEAGVHSDPKSGFIPVDDRQQTNVPGIYAVGDCCRPPMLAHKAYREGVVAAEAIAGLPTRFQFQCIPSVVFTTPELASVGLTREEAEKAGHKVRQVRFPYAALGRAHAAHSTEGWVKLVGDETNGAVLGLHAAGEAVGELVAEGGFAIEMGATVRDLAMTIHPHPTFSELLQEVALLWLGEPMHVAQRSAGRLA